MCFSLVQVIQQAKGVVVKQPQVGLAAQSQTQSKQMVIQTSTHSTGISYDFDLISIVVCDPQGCILHLQL